LDGKNVRVKSIGSGQKRLKVSGLFGPNYPSLGTELDSNRRLSFNDHCTFFIGHRSIVWRWEKVSIGAQSPTIGGAHSWAAGYSSMEIEAIEKII
jgi:hypothetical protein